MDPHDNNPRTQLRAGDTIVFRPDNTVIAMRAGHPLLSWEDHDKRFIGPLDNMGIPTALSVFTAALVGLVALREPDKGDGYERYTLHHNQ